MSRLALRLTAVFGVVGLLTVSGVATLAWFLAASESRESIDEELAVRGSVFEAIGSAVGTPLPEMPDGPLDPAMLLVTNNVADITLFQLYDNTGRALNGDAPVSAFDTLGNDGERSLRTEVVDGVQYRVLTLHLEDGFPAPGRPALDVRVSAIEIYRDVTGEEQALDDLAVRLVLASVLATFVVASVSWLVGRRLAHPIAALADTAAELAELDDIPGRVEVSRRDEIGGLADSYNKLMSALEVGREQQRRLVADASHELRTPLTSLRMRIEYLASTDLAGSERSAMFDAANADAERLTALVSDLVDLAADVRSAEEPPRVTPIAPLVDDVVRRARISTERDITVRSDDACFAVRPSMVQRAVQNLIDNAVKYSDGPIEAIQRGATIEVCDAGPGIGADDVAHVFDRFYRSPQARNRPGNGIGLAIVQQVADAHGGTTWAGRSPAGGARIGFSIADPHETLMIDSGGT